MLLQSWVRFLRPGSARTPTKQHRVRLQVESLEDRCVPSASGDYLLVPSFDTDNVLRYDGATGAFVDEFVHHKDGGLNQPVGAIFGPHDHNLYVGSGYYGGPGQLRAVLRFDGTTGKYIDQFTEPGHLEKVNQILFGPDGNGDGRQDLYVANGHEGGPGGVVRFDGITGAFIDDFVAPVAGRLRAPSGMVFGPSVEDATRLDLYIASSWYGNVLRFNGLTGAFLGEFANPTAAGLGNAGSITFGPDGKLYVGTGAFVPPHPYGGNPGVVRYQGPTATTPGAFIDVFVPPGSGGLLDPTSVLFGPDGNADGRQDLYVSSVVFTPSYQAKEHTSSVKRYDGVTGAFIDTFVPIDSGGLDNTGLMTFTRTDPMTLAYTGGEKLTVATLPAIATNETLAVNEVQPLLKEAFTRWQGAGVNVSALNAIDIRIADLGGATLGLASGHTIWLDDNAAGWGWFIDATPWDDSEFTTPGNQGEQHRMDLLTVLEHEVGHLLGYDHADDGVMAETLPAGVRRMPATDSTIDWAAIDLLFADSLRSSSDKGHGWLCHRDPICK